MPMASLTLRVRLYIIFWCVGRHNALARNLSLAEVVLRNRALCPPLLRIRPSPIDSSPWSDIR